MASLPVGSQPDTPAKIPSNLRRRISSHPAFPGNVGAYWEIATVVAIVLGALFFRTVNLSSLPAGFHGDEAVIGLEAQRILDEGYIGVYTERAAGQPTGPIYLVALAIEVFGQTVFAVRIVPALLGALTVLALYVVLRRNFGAGTALIGAGVLAAMSWHIHFARIGYPLEAWPLIAVLTAGTATEALRRYDWRWWAATGALTGSGIYVYNAHPLLAATVLLFLAAYVLLAREASLRQAVSAAAAFGVALVLVLIPMIRYATANENEYREHFDEARITQSEEWLALDSRAEQARFGLTRYRDVWDRLCCEPELDVVDGTGLTVVTPQLMIWLAGVGMLLALRRPGNPLIYLGLMIIVILPIGAALTIGGEMRRTLVIAPFLAMFCGLACSRLVEMSRRRGRQATLVVGAVVSLVLAGVVYKNLDLYFDDFAEPEVQNAILGRPLADAARYLDDHADGHYVYFYSSTWSIDYVTMQYLAPDIEGEDRSERFGDFNLRLEPGKEQPLFVFLKPYVETADSALRLYPGREVTPVGSDGPPMFRVVEPDVDVMELRRGGDEDDIAIPEGRR